MSKGYQHRFTTAEYETYTPDEHRNSRIFYFLSLVAIVMLGVSIVLTGSLFVFGILFVVMIVLSGVGMYFRERADEKVAMALMQQRNVVQHEVRTVVKEVKGLSVGMNSIRSAGHVVMAGEGAVVVIDSTISDSFIQLKRNDPVLADAVQTISGAIEKSGNAEAGEAWGRFLRELSGERDRSVMRALWERVVKLVPDVAKLIESAAKITATFP